MRWLVIGSLTLAAASLLVPSAPTYDPWAWLIWGREIAHGELSTTGGPAWKPLPVAFSALLSALGAAAPDAWLVVARAGAPAALGAAFLLARRLVAAPGEAGAPASGAGAGLGAAAAVALCDGFAWHAAVGNAEGLLLALGLLSAERALAGRPRQALALGFGAALLRPEAWPFLLALAAWVGWRDRAARPLVAGLLVAVPLLWIVPEWLGSGDPWRSSERARIPNPGAPALSDVPALESLRRAAAIPLAPTLVAAAALAAVAWRGRAPGRLVWPGLAGVAWIGLVAGMAQLGYSGEERYLLPGAALVALTGGAAVGLALERVVGQAWRERGRAAALPAGAAGLLAGASAGAELPAGASSGAAGSAPVALVAVLAVLAAGAPFVAPRARDVADDVRAASREARLFDALDEAVAAAGGREAILRCGRPYTGPLRGPAVAWHLGVAKSRVGFAPRAPGVAFVSRLPGRRRAEPPVPRGFAPVAEAGGWRVLRRCDTGRGR